MTLAGQIMSREVITTTLDTKVEELAKILHKHRIGGVPVLGEGGKLLGVVTENDLIDQSKRLHIPTMVSFLDSVIFLESAANFEKEIKKLSGCTVADICSREIYSVSEGADLEEIATIMSEHRVHTLPVMQGDTLVGVIGKSDVIKVLAK